MANPLLTDFVYAPFDLIKDEHYQPAVNEAIEIARQNVAKIKKDPPSFQNTIVGLERSGEKLDNISDIFSNALSAETNDTLQALAKEIIPALSNFSSEIRLDLELFKKIEAVKDQDENLNSEQRMLLEKTYKAFIRGGAKLEGEKKERLQKLDEESATLSLNFGDNVLKVTNEYFLHVKDQERLIGLPDSILEAAANKAKEKSVDGWAFTLDYPSVIPFQTYCRDRDLRKELQFALGSRCYKSGDTANGQNILEIVVRRDERAKLLGYQNHAEFILEERMAKTPEKVRSFLEELHEKARPQAEKDMKELKAYAKKLDNISDLMAWDVAYYFEKLKKEKFNIDNELLRPYFQLEKVLEGAFLVANKLYGITFKKITNIPTYHNDVSTFNVLDSGGDEVGLFYADFFPREGKRNGAWMTDYRKQSKFDGKKISPQVAIVCNFTPPSEKKPSLLTFQEVTTLFHEFGHALHGLLADTVYPSLSGTNVFWDFVELPSQIMENWVFESECLNLFANHYQTGEIIPSEFVENIKKSAAFFEAGQTLRQLGFGLVDLAWHTQSCSEIEDVSSIENEILKEVALLPIIDGTNFSCSFGHIFSGGYSAGYYSYKWAEVLDADAFDLFKEEGIFNRKMGNKFKEEILSQGGTKHPMDLYVNFRGRGPNIEPLLRRGGILS